ncbi:MAG TPA: response regulator, partial [Thermoanaerobaculia bacterium]|nr:response regulator [Thermoanaerobaculia bacterium]
HDYDLTILDLMMPRASGFDVLASVHSRDPGALQKIIVMTAAAAHVSSDLLSGVRQVVTKPFLIEELRAAIMEGLNSTAE